MGSRPGSGAGVGLEAGGEGAEPQLQPQEKWLDTSNPSARHPKLLPVKAGGPQPGQGAQGSLHVFLQPLAFSPVWQVGSPAHTAEGSNTHPWGCAGAGGDIGGFYELPFQVS